MKPAPEKNPIPSPTRFKGSLWDTARAVDPVRDSLTLVKVEQMRKDTTYGMMINIPNTLDKVVIKPITKTPQKRTDTIQAIVIANPKVTTQKLDTGVLVVEGQITQRDTVLNSKMSTSNIIADTVKEVDLVTQTVTPAKPLVAEDA
jgi:hypothetical protein